MVGGGNSAVSEAIYLSNICRKVYLVYRKNILKADRILIDRLEQINNIKIIYNAVISEYMFDNQKITGIRLENNCEIKASCIFLAIGHLPNSELFNGDKKNDYVVVDSLGRTSVDDVYACGDVTLKEVYQLVTASSEGAIVATSIIKSSQER